MMETYLKHYRMKIEAVGPIFIGSGEKIGKKEFIYIRKSNMVEIPDMEKFFGYLCFRHLEKAYVDYMLSQGNEDLGHWLKRQKLDEKEYRRFSRYTLDAGDALLSVGNDHNSGGSQESRAKAKEISCFMKDGAGNPYVPGSSIKGMIRTALLAYEIEQNESIRRNYQKEIRLGINDRGKNRRNFLKEETGKLETDVFHTVDRGEAVPEREAVCSNMSGLVIGDSDPISCEQLTLCQKMDYHLDRSPKPLPLLRECLKPGTEIFFDITIDPQIFPYSLEEILTALDVYQKNIYQNFYHRFGRGNNEKGTVWLGGGCGFPTKTVIAALFPKETASVTSDIFYGTIGDNYSRHKHNRDVSEYGVSPHVCKCTKYQHQLYDMGKGKLSVIE